MTLQKIEFEYDIPDGYRFVRYGAPKTGEFYINKNDVLTAHHNFNNEWPVVEKIPEQESKKHRWHDLMIEFANDKTLRFEYLDKLNNIWHDTSDNPPFLENVEYRKKQTKKTIKFRNYKFFNVYEETKIAVHYSGDDMEPEKLARFIEWAGDWQVVEI